MNICGLINYYHELKKGIFILFHNRPIQIFLMIGRYQICSIIFLKEHSDQSLHNLMQNNNWQDLILALHFHFI